MLSTRKQEPAVAWKWHFVLELCNFEKQTLENSLNSNLNLNGICLKDEQFKSGFLGGIAELEGVGWFE